MKKKLKIKFYEKDQVKNYMKNLFDELKILTKTINKFNEIKILNLNKQSFESVYQGLLNKLKK